MDSITVDRIIECERRVNPEDLALGKVAYPEFVLFFEERNPVERHDFILAAHFVYGWMPRMLNLREAGLQNALPAVNRAREVRPISDADFEALKLSINNSMVGVSKLLHFVNPALYPIWDRRVAAFVRSVEGRRRPVDDVRTYRAYLQRCHEIIRDPRFDAVYRSIRGKVRYRDFRIEPLRALELVMWVGGGKVRKDAWKRRRANLARV